MNNTTCFNSYYPYNEEWCPPDFDKWLCWPPTPPGENVSLECPHLKGILRGGKAQRICLDTGKWEVQENENSTKSFTHYEDCLIPELKNLLNMCNAIEGCPQIFKTTRNIEMVGLSFSLISLIISLFIFFHYRVLKNNRTKIHKNLFIATLLQVIFRLIEYVDQMIFKNGDSFIEQTPYLNETCIALLEYAKTAMFMWMFIEGLYLHNMITVMVFQEYSYVKLFFYIGWTVPAVMTAIWVITMLAVKSNWGFYYFMPYFWILEGPRYIIIVVNLFFLVNIIRVLIVKLRESQACEIELVRKGVRAAIFLLPLLGTANIFFWVDHSFTQAWKLALWLYTSYFLNTFQGFFVAVLYCFLNGEVQTAIKNSFYLHMSLRNHDYTPCRNLTVTSSVPEPDTVPNGDSNKWMRKYLKKLKTSERTNDTDETCDLNGSHRNSTLATTLTMVETKPITRGNSDA